MTKAPPGGRFSMCRRARLGEEVVRVAKNIQNTTDRVVLWGATSTVTCPGRQPAGPVQTAAVPVGASPTGSRSNIRMVDGDPVPIPLGSDDDQRHRAGERRRRSIQRNLPEAEEGVALRSHRDGDSQPWQPWLYSQRKILSAAIGDGGEQSHQTGCAEQAIVDRFLDLEKQYVPIWKAAK